MPTLRRALCDSGLRPLRMVTKNIDLPQIRARFRAPAAKARPRTYPATRQFRHVVERRPWLRGIKASVNLALRATRLGDTLEAVAIKDSR